MTEAATAPRVLSASTVAETRWLRLSTLSYVDQTGRERQWDCISRTTRPAESDVDGVAILALLRSGSSIETLLVEQFRPPVNTFTIELPAGLVDKGETAAEAALRGELAISAGRNRPLHTAGRMFQHCRLSDSLGLSPALPFRAARRNGVLRLDHINLSACRPLSRPY